MADIVILGGGVVGMSTALQLQKMAPKSDDIIVIDRQDEQYYAPSLLWILSGEKRPESIFRKTASVAANNKVIFIHDEAKRILSEENKVVLKKEGSLSYDILIITTGADYDHKLFPKLAKAGDNLWQLEGMMAFHKKLNQFQGGTIALMAPEMPIKGIGSFYEVPFLLKTLFQKRGMGDKVTVNVYTPESTPFGGFDPFISQYVLYLLREQNIHFHCQSEFVGVSRWRSRLEFTDKTVDYDLLAYVPPHRGATVTRGSGLEDEHGWIKTDPHNLTTCKENVFAGGDAAVILTPEGEFLPKIGSVATFQALTLSRNALAALYGKKPTAQYRGTSILLLENSFGKCLPAFGSFYGKKKNRFTPFPNSRWFKLLKKYAEYRWLRGKPSYPPWV